MTTMRSTDYSLAVVHTASGLFWMLVKWAWIWFAIWALVVLVMSEPWVLLIPVALWLVYRLVTAEAREQRRLQEEERVRKHTEHIRSMGYTYR